MLLDVPIHLRTNAVLANISLYLCQLLRWLAEGANVDGIHAVLNPREQSSASAECVGFSTGMFAAAVVASSRDILTFLTNAVDIMRALFWLGARCQAYAVEQSLADPSEPATWSLVLFGSSRTEVRAAVTEYNSKPHGALYIAAFTSDNCVTVAGRPESLLQFRREYLPETTISSKFLDINTLYHSSALEHVKEQILHDVHERDIRIPTYASLRFPLRSTKTGESISSEHHPHNSTLLDDLLDMTLVHPVDFESVLRHLRPRVASANRPFRLVNIGPCTGLWRTAARSLTGLQLAPVDWSTPSNEAVSRALDPPRPSLPPPSGPETQEPVAIIGMAATFPGARDANALWDLLKNGRSTLTEIPQDRFEVPAGLAARHGNFLAFEDAAGFDAGFFRVAPRAARAMDPQQRVLLHLAKHALDGAGFAPRAAGLGDAELDGVGVFVGAATGDYVENLNSAGEQDAFYSTGTLRAFLAGRVAHAFGFGGPAEVVDTACSSSLVAIHNACRALASGECDMALAGGVNIIASPEMHVGLERAHFLSPTGQCRPWDAAADGYARAEGGALFVLKRLRDARAADDRVLGVIRSTARTQSGRATSITHPHVPAQVALLRRLLDGAGARPGEVGVVEAHGTGTRAGDPAEMAAVRAVFGRGDESGEGPLHVTSVKANIGHAEAASGAAGLVKLVLMLRERAIPPTISLVSLNPRIPDLSADGIRINKELAGWERPRGGRRTAVLNNFGAAGSNAALLLEEPPEVPSRTCHARPAAFVLGLSCHSVEALETFRGRYLCHMQEAIHSDLDLEDFTFSATARRQLYRYRIAVSGASKEELCERLQNAQAICVDGEGPAQKVVFVFSGQGAQYAGMGKGLYASLPSFRRTVHEAHERLCSWGYPGILDVINPTQDVAFPGDIVAEHPAMFVLEYALASASISWGVKPDIVVGHRRVAMGTCSICKTNFELSLGEYAALVVAGVMSFDDALRLVVERARLIDRKCAKAETGMLAIRADAERITEMLENEAEFRKLSIACYNSDIDCVVAGPLTPLSSLEGALRESGCRCIQLDVRYAYHTGALGPILDDLHNLASTIDLSPPTIPVLSNLFGRVISPADGAAFDADYFSRHCVEPVLFVDGIRHLLASEQGADFTWIELGPHPTTLPMLRNICSEGFLGDASRMRFIPTLRRDTPDLAGLSAALSSLYCAYADINWQAVFHDIAPDSRLVDLPAYPLQLTEYWVPYRSRTAREALPLQHSVPQPGTSLLGRCVAFSERNLGITFETRLVHCPLVELIEGHRVAGSSLCPASVYLELALQALSALLRHVHYSRTDLVVEAADVVYTSPLVLHRDADQIVQTEITIADECGQSSTRAWSFSVSSREERSHGVWQGHCSGKFFEGRASRSPEETTALESSLSSRLKHMLANPTVFADIQQTGSETFGRATIYDLLFPRIVEYTSAYKTIHSMTLQSDPPCRSGDVTSGLHVYAGACIPTMNDAFDGAQKSRSIFIDTLLHAAGFAVNYRANFSTDTVYICASVGTLCGNLASIPPGRRFGVYVYVTPSTSQCSGASADAYAIETEADGRVARIVICATGIQFRRVALDVLRCVLQQKASRSAASLLTPATSSPPHVPPSPPFPVLTPLYRSLAHRLTELIASTCGVPLDMIKPETRLEELGIDSLMSIELSGKFRALSRQAPGLNRAANFELALYSSRTIEELLKDCSSMEPLAFLISPNPLPLYTAKIDPSTPHGLPLFLIHDGAGTAHPYARLDYTGLGREVYGIHNPRFVEGHDWPGGVIEMAKFYKQMVFQALQTGWSFGGVVAFELARQLIDAGVHVPGIILIDAPPPSTKLPLPDVIIDFVLQPRASSSLIDLSKLQMRLATRALVTYEASASPAAHVAAPHAVFIRARESLNLASEQLESNAPEAADVVPPLSDSSPCIHGLDAVKEWAECLGREVRVLDAPGNHFTMFEEMHSAELSLAMRRAVAMLQPV
ncbi:hypothetical protein CERSUDRAFT_128472 [Gelatoporia subvermispora B]|uniref:Uncharacterized protein n=1 Tax=Ceriporiopsis subvermispora (strain B) TaxID=914234 RepID=M2QYX2_CERS8|nr:hypothetical protein CERSUDRAFT_128472 [Gelatoporia subvermispora B]